MKILSAAFAAAGALAFLAQAAAVPAQPKWTVFQPPDAGFRIEFPGTPEVTKDTMPSQAGPAPHLAGKLGYESTEYSIELTTYASPSDPEAVLDLFANAFAKEEKARPQTRLKIGNIPARRLEIEMKEGQIVATMLLVTDGTRVFQVRCITPKGKGHSANVTRLINSFTLVQQ